MSQVASDTPMMRQFNALKADYPDCILFFRAGDFYEMFGEDAVQAAEALNIALTSRDRNSETPIPMAGVPYHACESYLNKLTSAGFKVAIAEQMEDPAQAKGVVRREVVRVVTPGTTTADALLAGDRNHYLMALEARRPGKPLGLALADLSTGALEVVQFPAEAEGRLLEFLTVEHPSELLLPRPRGEREQERAEHFAREVERRLAHTLGEQGFHLEWSEPAWFDGERAARVLTEQYGTANLAGFGVDGMDEAVRAAGALLAYLQHTQKSELAHLAPLRPRRPDEGMWLDEATLAHLEVFENRAPGGQRHTLFAVLNQTRTPMGARMLRRWLARPLTDHAAIAARMDAVSELAGAAQLRAALREALGGVGDLERIVGRISLPQVGVADMVALREALGAVQLVAPLLGELEAALLGEVAGGFDPMEDIWAFLKARFAEEPALKLTAGGYIAEGVNAELDRLRELSRDSRQVIGELEGREREATGIGSLKVRYNKVFGYYLEISKPNADKVPAHYIRKQTLVNAERYVTPELQEIEEQILGAEERIAELEYEAFGEARTILRGYARRMLATAQALAVVDALAGLAEAAVRHDYVRPALQPPEGPRRMVIEGGRHPVIERIDFDEPFIPNDVALDAEGEQILLITGPNMAGKSTVMRQVALTQLMAQAGSFVPAARAELCLVDRIFTRVGASDNLARGQSTFMLEMNEAANILNNATANSLIVLDEIGRGTSTYDGISIAWAMVEHIHRLGALTLFATHYHELTRLAAEWPRVANHNMSILEDGEALVFTRKLARGEADRSYGIQVARLAGLPPAVVERAHEVMGHLSATAGNGSGAPPAAGEGQAHTMEPQQGPPQAAGRRAHKVPDGRQLSLLNETHPMLERIRTVSLDDLSPREALNLLYEVQRGLRGDET